MQFKPGGDLLLPRILWISLLSQKSIGFLWFLDAFSYRAKAQCVRGQALDTRCLAEQRGFGKATYNFCGVEALRLFLFNCGRGANDKRVSVGVWIWTSGDWLRNHAIRDLKWLGGSLGAGVHTYLCRSLRRLRCRAS